MNRLPKASLAAFAACALALGACGSDSDDEPNDVTTAAPTEATDAPADDATDETIAETDDATDTGDTGELPAEAEEIAIGMFEDMGLSNDQATCLVDKLGMDEMAAGESPDMTAVMEYLEECDIDPTDLSGG